SQLCTALSHKQSWIENQFIIVNREREHGAAVTIQSWFRGCKIRAHIRYNMVQKWKKSILMMVWLLDLKLKLRVKQIAK
uniref:Uncharacterized protein n=1 Tax=Callorhinchus milii TaxID=7868 RepID=A0A4W3JJQ2_CALMI